MIQKGNFKNNQMNTMDKIAADSAISAYYASDKYDKSEIFDKHFAQGLELMCGDKLLKPALSINSVQIRKTTTPGLYKLILNSPEFKIKVRHIDEGQLLNNRQYCRGTVSLIDVGVYELMYYDSEDEIVIKQCSKEGIIDFMSENKLIFQL